MFATIFVEMGPNVSMILGLRSSVMVAGVVSVFVLP